jgi:hypothetical protein
LQDADKKGLSRIGEEVKQLAQKAKENSLKPEDFEVRIVVLCSLLLMDGLLPHGWMLNAGFTLFAGRYIYSVKFGRAFWNQAILRHH